MKVFIKIAVIVLIIFLPAISLFSHPHVFIENSFAFIFDDNNLEGIRVKWVFDEMFSASVIMDFDIDRNNIFEGKEIKAVEEGAFSNLENYHYYLYVTIGNTQSTVSTIQDFTAEIKNNRIIYYFFVPLDIKSENKEKRVQVGCYDNTYFCHVYNSETDPVILENNSGLECSWEIVEDKDNVYWVTIIPEVVVLQFRMKNE
jgi:ABC-type uncharacterized transport system substrate-binding protein